MTVVATTQAEAFATRHADYLFEDAHHLVEAAAATEAHEVTPNQFRFADGSILEIQSHRCRVVCHPA